MDTQEKMKIIKAWQNENPLRIWRASQTPRIGIHTAALMLGVTPSTIQTWEGGMHSPRYEHLVKLEEITGGAANFGTWKTWEDKRPQVGERMTGGKTAQS